MRPIRIDFESGPEGVKVIAMQEFMRLYANEQLQHEFCSHQWAPYVAAVQRVGDLQPLVA